MKKVGIIGHFGLGLDLSNGQTIKTKIITESLSKVLNEKIYIVDSHGGIKALFPVIKGCLLSLIMCKNIIFMLTENGLKVVVPILSILNHVFRRSIHYVVIGGWLPAFLEKKSRLLKYLKTFDHIYVETKTMFDALCTIGLDNVIVMTNYKDLHILKKEEQVYTLKEPFKLCTFSRVMKEKGIEDIIYAINKINEVSNKVIYELDIYGQIDENQIMWFNDLKSHFPEHIKYKGVISYEKSVDILKNYFALVFPTKFYTEGVPGTVIDAYAAGTPVIASKWESFGDVIELGVTGDGYSFGNVNELIKLLQEVALYPQKINDMREACLDKAKEFTSEKAIKVLLDKLK